MAARLTETGASAVDGEPGARLGRLVRKQLAFVWRLLRRIGLSETEVDAAVREVFSAVAQRIADVRPSNERAFLFSTALHVAARVRRKRGAQAVPSPRAPALEDLDQAGQAREILAALLEQMPLELRVVFVLREIEQLSLDEIAGIVGIPLGTVSARLGEAQADFATHLDSSSEMSLSLIAAARAERVPPALLAGALTAAGVPVTAADRAPGPAANLARAADSEPVAAARRTRSPLMLAASWIALGWIVGLVLASAVWALRDAATPTTSPTSVAH
ncbi:MAG TPA: sigma-70 family RNA polymerase sigma factor [Polyangiaceae bacterium]|nr:sigma-70 family RNA polymerase sigma factor [Polyangiaceae bacterium]